MLANYHLYGEEGLQRDHAKAIELFIRSANLGCNVAHYDLADVYYGGGNMKKAKFHYEAAAMAGHAEARYNLGCMEVENITVENLYIVGKRAMKHFKIAACAGQYVAMNRLRTGLEAGVVSIEEIESTLVAYNNSCAEMRSEARDAFIRIMANVSQPPTRG
jgi:TPR repeat protein